MLHTCSACSDLIMAAIRGHVDCRVVENPFSRWIAARKTRKKIMVRKLFPSSNQQGHKKKWNIGPKLSVLPEPRSSECLIWKFFSAFFAPISFCNLTQAVMCTYEIKRNKRPFENQSNFNSISLKNFIIT